MKNLHYIFEFLTPQSPASPLWERLQHFCQPDNCSRLVKLNVAALVRNVLGPADAKPPAGRPCG